MQTDELYLKNVNIIHKIANKYKSWAYTQGITYEELVSTGGLAFMLSVKGFREQSTTKFSTYLYTTIENMIVKELMRGNRNIEVPLYIKEYANQIKKDGNDQMTKEDLMLVYGLTEKVAYGVQTHIKGSLKETPIHNIVETKTDSHTGGIPNEDTITIDTWIASLNGVDKEIVIRKVQGETNTSIATDLGVSNSAISKRLQKLKQSLYYILEEEENHEVIHRPQKQNNGV